MFTLGTILTWSVLAIAQVDEGDLEVVNIRETDSRLGPLVYTLLGLGVFTLVLTALFWWLTRPRSAAPNVTDSSAETHPNTSVGADHG